MLDFSTFTCLIGLNSAGKSTILQVIDFISQQMKGEMTKWLKTRNWEECELESKVIKNKNIVISLGFIYNRSFYIWDLKFDTNVKKIIHEDISLIGDRSNELKDKKIFKVKHSKFMIDKDGDISEGDIIQEYEGSFLAKLKPELLPDVIVKLRDIFKISTL